MSQKHMPQQNTDNKQEKIMNLDMLIRQIELITTAKKNAFLVLIQQLRQYPNEDSYIKLKNLLQSLQPVLCTVASKVALFENDHFATNDPQMPLLASIKNESVTELQQSTKLQIEEIDSRVIQCPYETYNRELAREMFKINDSVDFCIGHLLDKFEAYGGQKEKKKDHTSSNNKNSDNGNKMSVEK